VLIDATDGIFYARPLETLSNVCILNERPETLLSGAYGHQALTSATARKASLRVAETQGEIASDVFGDHHYEPMLGGWCLFERIQSPIASDGTSLPRATLRTAPCKPVRSIEMRAVLLPLSPRNTGVPGSAIQPVTKVFRQL